MHLRLNEFTLPDSAGLENIDRFQGLAKRASEIGASSGKSSRWFDKRCNEFRALLGSESRIQEFVDVRKDVRVVLHLWKADPEWLEWRQPSTESLRHLVVLAKGFRSSHLIDLQDIYFRYFDALQHCAVLGRLISDSLQRLDPGRLMPIQRRLHANRNAVFDKNGPIMVAKSAIEAGNTFEDHIDKVGLRQNKVGRYAHACKNAYYVETVRGLRIGESHPLLKEVSVPQTKESAYDGKLNLGQKVAQVMIRKCADHANGMPEAWVDYVKSLLCDPRIPVRTDNYQKWWAAMDRKDEDNLRRWLAGADLRLFLEILKESSTDKDLLRMYPTRRKFLEGLLDQNDVLDARLFLSERARSMIRKEYGPKALAAHGSLSDPHKSVIYVNVENKVHFFEGTHNYAARGGGVLPENHRVLSRTAKSFSYRELSTELDLELEKAGAKASPPLETIYVRHHPPITWQANMIMEFEYYGVKVDAEAIFTSKDYLTYRRDYGI